MTRKDYEMIAAAIREVRSRFTRGSASEAVVSELAGQIAAALMTDNPQFDVVRFVNATL